MDDLISREAALKSIRLWRGMLSVETAAAEIIALSAVDAVPVVRCGECKWWKIDDDVGYCTNPDGLDNYAKLDDFCSYGVRKALPEGEEARDE